MTKAWSMKHAGTLSYGILGYWKKNFISFFLLQRLGHWKKEFYFFFLFLHNLPISVRHNLHCIAKRGYSRPDQERHETQNSGSYCLKEINILHIYIPPLSTSRDNHCPSSLTAPQPHQQYPKAFYSSWSFLFFTFLGVIILLLENMKIWEWYQRILIFKSHFFIMYLLNVDWYG